MVEICAVASGSNGNCYYIGNSESAVLVDAGVSCRRITDRMISNGLNPTKVKAIFISHEHVDHYCGARVLSKKIGVPVYITSKTLEQIKAPQRPGNTLAFIPGDVIGVDGFTVHSFPKNHDAAEPSSFRVEYHGINVGIFTDIGTPCDNVRNHMKECHALFLESNYDEDMLWTGRYPYPLKVRIASDKGHLSNIQASELPENHRHPELRMVFLSHLSAENNSPEIALTAFDRLKQHFAIEAADRHSASKVYVVRRDDITGRITVSER